MKIGKRWLAGFLLPRIGLLLLTMCLAIARAQDDGDIPGQSPDLAPDLRDTDLPVSVGKGNFVAVPIPMSNPTLGEAIIGAAAYFYPQTEEQRQTQPPSATGFGVMYTSNDSYGVAAGHAGYWNEDRWRFKGAITYADLKLPLLALGENSDLLNVDWLIKGTMAYSEIARRLGEHWYLGLSGRHVDVDQNIQVTVLSQEFDILDSFAAAGLGTSLAFDTRDVPTNAYEGLYFRATALFNRPSIGGDVSYDAYSLAFKSYHSLGSSLVLAWEIAACMRSDGVPLWDACKIGLRGFPSTDHLGKSSNRAQVEARWLFSQRWSLAAFAGAGRISETLTGFRDNETIPSYGLGVRFMVSTENRINMRLDYARSTDSDAVYLFVGEAF